MTLIYHLALRAEWNEANSNGGPYRRSTFGKTLAEVGFIHCSFQEQVQQIADLLYAGRTDVVLLTIDTDGVDADVRVEGGFPHIYGELPISAVVSVEAWPGSESQGHGATRRF
jgi:uncharacterized protein (DUF952 family)